MMSLDKKILLADDDSDFLEATQLMLMDEGYNVTPAADGEEAITKYRDIQPDIVFLDIKMQENQKLSDEIDKHDLEVLKEYKLGLNKKCNAFENNDLKTFIKL